MAHKFKYKLRDKVFIIGLPGVCIITGVGTMTFTSGGKLNMYQLGGAHNGYYFEDLLMTPEEYSYLIKDKI